MGDDRRRVVIDLPTFPPSVNHLWRRSRNGRIHVSSAGRSFRSFVRVSCLRDGTPRLEGELTFEAAVFFPDHRRRDLDNILKALLDAFEHAGIYHDDSQIVDLRIRREGYETGGRVFVRISEMEERTDNAKRRNQA